MNKLMRRFIAVMLAVLLTFTCIPSYTLALAVDSVEVIVPEDYLFYTVSEQGVVIDYYDGNFSEFTIPDMIGDEPVIEIGSGAFANRDESFYVEIPASITAIAEDAFVDSPNISLRVVQGSFAEIYAQENGIRYSLNQTAEEAFDCSVFIGRWKLTYASIYGNEGTAENLGIVASLNIIDDTYMEMDIAGQITGYELEVENGELIAYDGETERILSINEKGNLITHDGQDYLEFERENTNDNVEVTDVEEIERDKAATVAKDSTNIGRYIGEWKLEYVEQEGVAINAKDANMHGTLIIKDDGSGEMIQGSNSISFTWQDQNDSIYIHKLNVELYLDDQDNLHVESLVFVKDDESSEFFDFFIGNSEIDDSEIDGSSETLPEYEIVDIAAGYQHSVGLRRDGTVIATGSNANGECDTEGWTDVVQVMAGIDHTVGLTSNGELLIAGDAPLITANENIRSISSYSGSYHIAVVKQDGTVVSSRNITLVGNDYIQVSASSGFLVALRNDGTAVVAGESYYNECDVDDWENIVQVAAGYYHTIGLRADGTVVATGYNKNDQCEVSDWTNIVSVAAGYDFSVGVDADGFVHVAAYEKDDTLKEFENWTDIAKVAISDTHVIGLKTDGTVVAAGINNRYGTCDTYELKDVKTAVTADGVTAALKRDGSVEVVGDDYDSFDIVSEWSNIEQIDMGSGLLVGLTKEGRVLVEGFIRWNEADARDWTEIKQIAVGSGHIVGLKRDGTVVAVGNNEYGDCDVANWHDICQVAAGNGYTLGLKKDGTVVATGTNHYSQCDVSSWKNISRIDSDWYCSMGISGSGKLMMTGDVEEYTDAVEWNDIVQTAVTSDHIVALKADGTVLSTGGNNYGQCNTESWRDIVWVSTDLYVTVGVKADGTVVATGKGHNKGGKCDVQTWGIPYEVEAEEELSYEEDYVTIQTTEQNKYMLPAMTDETEYWSNDSYKYSLFDDGSAILLYKDCRSLKNTKLVIPDKVDGHTVIAIGTELLFSGDEFTEIVVPDSVIYIDDLAFDGCDSLEKITLGNHVEDMGANPFADCETLRIIEISAENPYLEVVDGVLIQKTDGRIIANLRTNENTAYVVPEYIKSIGGYAFAYSTVQAIELPETFEWIGENAFYGSEIQSLELPKSMKVLGNYALYNCRNLSKIALPETMEAIGDYAFGSCYDLIEIELPIHLKQIGDYAFEGCSSIQELNIPMNVMHLGDYAFAYCRELESIVVNGNYKHIGINPFIGCEGIDINIASEESPLKIQDDSLVDLSTKTLVAYLGKKQEYVVPEGIQRIGGGAFEGSGIVKVTLPDGVIAIDDSAFESCREMTNLIMPDTVEYIGNKAFYACRNMSEFSVSKNLVSIGDFAFYDCDVLTSLKFGELLETIGDEAFRSCEKLYDINFPESMTCIGEAAFVGCTALSEVTLKGNGLKVMDGAFANTGVKEVMVGTGVEELGDNAFSYLEALEKVIFESGVTKIGTEVFYGCEGLKEIVLPEGLETIGDRAFYYCRNLKSISLPESLTSIGNEAFAACAITQMVLPEAVTNIGEAVFSGCSSLVSVKFNNELVTLPERTFDNCSALSNVVFTQGLKEIGTRAFGCCDSLGDFELPDGLEVIGDTAFYSCNGIFNGELVVPETVKYIGASAFSECGIYKATFKNNPIEFGGNPFPYSSDVRIVAAEDHPTIRVVDGVMFSKIDNSLVYFPRFDDGFEQVYVIPQGTEIIAGNAFKYPCNIDEVVLPDSVTTIGEYAFNTFYGLRNLDLPASVQQIREGAFYCCNDLISIVLPEGITEIADRTFYACDSLTEIAIPESVLSIGKYAFYDCTSLYGVTLSEGLETIEDRAFADCESLSRIRIPRSVSFIHRDSFYSYGNDADYIEVTLEVYEGSYAHMYAQIYGFDYEIVGDGKSEKEPSVERIQFTDYALETMVRSAFSMSENAEFNRESLNEIEEFFIGLKSEEGYSFSMGADDALYGTESCYYLNSLEDLKWFPNTKRLLMTGLISKNKTAAQFLATIPDSIALEDIEISG